MEAELAGIRKPSQQTEVGLTLFDHFVGAGNERGRHAEPERLGGLEMNHEVEFSRLLDRKVTGFSPLRIRPV